VLVRYRRDVGGGSWPDLHGLFGPDRRPKRRRIEFSRDFQLAHGVLRDSHRDPTECASGKPARLHVNRLVPGDELHKATPVIAQARTFLRVTHGTGIDLQSIGGK
jgi:hypothetical protein